MFVNSVIKYEKVLIVGYFPYKEIKLTKNLWLFRYLATFVQNIKGIPLNITKHSRSRNSKEIRGIHCQLISNETSDCLRFEISSEKMNELLAHRQICANDVRCLDFNSKQCLKKLCLNTCLYNLNYSNSSSKRLDNLQVKSTIAMQNDD